MGKRAWYGPLVMPTLVTGKVVLVPALWVNP